MAGYQQVDLFDMENANEKKDLNKLLHSKNVFDCEHHVGFSPMGGCKILMFYRIQDPKDRDVPLESLDDGNP